MRALVALVRREFRDARWSLLAAVVLSFLGLASLGLLGVRPSEVPEATARVLQLELAIWTLLCSADLFATDFASGRMATKALLPVSSWTILGSKFVYLILALAFVAALALCGALLVQISLGNEHSLGQFVHLLPSLARLVPWLFPLATCAALCSMLFETSLAATLLAAGATVLSVATRMRVEFALSYIGIEWGPAEWRVASWVAAAFLLATCVLAFVRGQRRLGQRALRVKAALQFLGGSVSVGALLIGPVACLRASSELNTPNVDFVEAAATPDGRYLALEVRRLVIVHDENASEGSSGHYDETPSAVWLIDLESGARELVARPGALFTAPGSYGSPYWDASHPLLVVQRNYGPWDTPADVLAADVLAVEVGNEGWTIAPSNRATPFDARNIPTWAELVSVTNDDGSPRSRIVRWKERGLEVTFENQPWVGRQFQPSSVPGKILVARGEQLVLRDMETGTESVVFDESAPYAFLPSPDGSAVLVLCEDETRALSSSDGALLHEPWSRVGRRGVLWIPGSGSARLVRLEGLSSEGTYLLDLDTGRAIELACEYYRSLLLSVGDRGYVYEDRDGDLVWADLDGKLVKVLVDR